MSCDIRDIQVSQKDALLEWSHSHCFKTCDSPMDLISSKHLGECGVEIASENCSVVFCKSILSFLTMTIQI